MRTDPFRKDPPVFDSRPAPRGLAVPSSRISRLARFGGLASGVAGGVALNGARELARGRRPSLGALILTPANITRLTDELSRMRGAAMKVGQLMSMDTGDVLPPELSDILARLRAEAHPMPPRQLKAVLNAAWGEGWLKRFERFDATPIAAASIGQVHRGWTRDGRDMAIKVQYPGVRRSIDSDVDNVAALVRMSGLLPKGLDVSPMLAEAKRQLHEEADYRREGAQLARFGALLADAADYAVPALHADFTTDSVLAMGFVPGAPVERMVDAPQAERDRIGALLFALLFRELFDFRLMQTDPNFANYRWDKGTGRLVLLDFGAARAVPEALAENYRALLRAGVRDDRETMRETALAIGFFAPDTDARHQAQVLDMMGLAFAPLRRGGPFDFGDDAMPARMRDAAMAMAEERDFVHVPPMDALFLQRKIAGVYLLASRLRARVDVAGLLAPWIDA
ncbi:MAG: AarF/ABC1/UbiB kinase family protein [Rhodobacteraceae bacterium]|nr:MAG: AarF/ABC1/UbiB kinase family protein [Paracoccaceae bacterium]